MGFRATFLCRLSRSYPQKSPIIHSNQSLFHKKQGDLTSDKFYVPLDMAVENSGILGIIHKTRHLSTSIPAFSTSYVSLSQKE